MLTSESNQSELYHRDNSYTKDKNVMEYNIYNEKTLALNLRAILIAIAFNKLKM